MGPLILEWCGHASIFCGSKHTGHSDSLTAFILIGGKKDALVGKLQERYGYKKDEAEKEVDDYIDGL